MPQGWSNLHIALLSLVDNDQVRSVFCSSLIIKSVKCCAQAIKQNKGTACVPGRSEHAVPCVKTACTACPTWEEIPLPPIHSHNEVG